MKKDTNEQLSALVDDELDVSESLVNHILNDEASTSSWKNYHLIRDSISGHMYDANIDISSQVSLALEAEPAILAPVHKKTKVSKSLPNRTQYFMKQAAGLAIAATVSAVAVISVQQSPSNDPISNQSIAATTNNSQSSHSQAHVQYVTEKQSLDHAVQSKLSNYLVNHNEYSVSSSMQGVLPYMRIVTANPGERVVVRSANDQ